MRPQHRAAAPAAALLLAALAGCGVDDPARDPDSTPAGAAAAPAAADAFPMTIDNCGTPVTLQRRPEKVLTVGWTAVNLLHAAGAADTISARSGEFGTPLTDDVAATVRDVPVVEEGDPTLEAIIGARPDVVIGYGLFETTPQDVTQAGITPLTVTGECGHESGADAGADFDDVYTDITTYGKVFGTRAQAEESVADLTRRVAAVTAQRPGNGLTAAGAYFWGETLSVTGKRDITHAQMTALGLTDAFADLDKAFAEVNLEALIDKDPDVILLSYGTTGESAEHARRQLLSLPGAQDLTAVRTGRIVMLPATMRGPDPNAVDGLEVLSRGLQQTGT